MGRCEACGNDYDRSFEVVMDDRTHVFDSFECAIHLLAPLCNHCNCRIIGHGVQVGECIYCCAYCSTCEGETGIRDRTAATTNA